MGEFWHLDILFLAIFRRAERHHSTVGECSIHTYGRERILCCSHNGVDLGSYARKCCHDDRSPSLYRRSGSSRYCSSWSNILGADLRVVDHHALGDVSTSITVFQVSIANALRDMSFPAANLLLSNQMAKEHQGVSASLVNTVINYSISIALGIAGTVETHIDVGGTDLLKGYRAAWYLAIGLAGSGTIIAGLYGANTWRTSRKVGKAEGDKVVDDHIQSRTNH